MRLYSIRTGHNNKMEQTYSTREIIWAKVKGYPWWPAKVLS